MTVISGAEIPLPARVVTTCLSMLTICVLGVCLVRRAPAWGDWSKIPWISWVVLAIYTDSFLFILSTAILSKSWSINSSTALCEAAILICVACYMTTKILIYYFLVEKVFIIRGSTTTRFKDKLWCFNVFGVILPFVALVILNFVFRIAYINDKGVCTIGLQEKSLFPLISFDCVLNIYLTSLFLTPLYQLYSYKNKANPALRAVAVRTFVGSVATLISSVANLTVLATLRGEAGWICLMLCNLDILFSVLVLHWATAIDKRKNETRCTHDYAAQYGTHQPTCDLNRSGIREITDFQASVTAGNRQSSFIKSARIDEDDDDAGAEKGFAVEKGFAPSRGNGPQVPIAQIHTVCEATGDKSASGEK